MVATSYVDVELLHEVLHQLLGLRLALTSASDSVITFRSHP